jgi:hypothetical protein
MALLRFVLSRRDPDSGVAQGVFELAHELRESAGVAPEHRLALAAEIAWFEKNLEIPTRFNRTSSKGFYRRTTRGISWLKDTAAAHLEHMHAIRRLLQLYGHGVGILAETRVGYVIYEDEFQVVAEPFADTTTG